MVKTLSLRAQRVLDSGSNSFCQLVMVGERLLGGWASAGEAEHPPTPRGARPWGRTVQLLICPASWSESLHP